MKTLKIYFLAAAAVTLSGCEKFLDQAPDQRAELATKEHISELLVTAYPASNWLRLAEPRMDYIIENMQRGDNDIARSVFYFEDPESVAQDSPQHYWTASYKAIAVANEVLVAIAARPNPTEFNAQKGEALVARAYAHFMLVNLFSKFYHAETASQNMGIPYITGPQTDLDKKQDRSTVQETYNRIERDLLEGLPLLVDNYKISQFHFNTKAAYAFASRFYLYQRRFEEAYRYADLAIRNDIVPQLRDWNNIYTNLGWQDFQRLYASTDEKANLLIARTTSAYGNNYYTTRYSLSSATMNTVLRQTIVGDLTSMTAKIFNQSLQTYYLLKMSSFFEYTGTYTTIGWNHTYINLFTVEEVFFNKMEAMAYLGRLDEVAYELSRYVRTRVRSANYNAANHTINRNKVRTYFFPGVAEGDFTDEQYKEGLVKAILQFRRAEFVHEGLCYFDRLRTKQTFRQHLANGKTLVIPYDHDNTAYQLPAEAANEGMPLNPRSIIIEEE